ncbi:MULTISPECIES: dCTP deaminase [Stenotrophomonas]|uniref:Deoxycytidine deaminase n=1 Tax=Stenotrophomonas maltophilia TaxID=40324 RepID=A0A3S0HYH7_STEMA|nr:deoxycytidine deaminase [Stenotrophomonas maltophilia]RTQ90704.1 deoxycytidine deaminase [Stenotrophomonas maltophilia]
MLVVSENLKGIAKSFDVCPGSLVEEFSLKILLDRTVRRMRDDALESSPVRYGSRYNPDDFFFPEEQIHDSLMLLPGQNCLACSQHEYFMPPGYFGLVQTKGSLARLFVTATANDGQVEPGYKGKITLELSNLAKFAVSIPSGSEVAQMFVFRCSSNSIVPYNGRYQNAQGPTVASF